MLHNPLFSNQSRRAMRYVEWLLVLLLVAVSLYTMIGTSDARREAKGTGNDSVPNVRHSSRNARTSYTYATPEEPVETFPFDPNTADSTALLRLGLAPWQVRAIYRYRAKHGRYHTPEDFARTPGMTGELWERLSPCIRIGEKYRLLSDGQMPRRTRQTAPVSQHSADSIERIAPDETPRDTILRPVKYPEGTKIDVGRADTTELKKIPGIASYRARKIVEYRQRLGGFAHLTQVMEACELPDEVLEWFILPSPVVQKVRINEASVQTMMRHPYITFYMAKEVNEWRHKHGRIEGPATLQQLKGFDADTMERLQDYIEY